VANLVEKIASLYADRDRGAAPAPAGSVLRMRPRHVLVEHEPDPAPAPEEVFDERQGVRPPSREPGRWMLREGYVIPGCFCVGVGPGVDAFGAVSALAARVVPEDLAETLRTGRWNYRVPSSLRLVVATGEHPASIASRILRGVERFPGHAVEVTGDLAHISIDERADLAERGVSDGAEAVLFPWDGVLRDWCAERASAFAARGDRPRKITEKLVEKFERTALAADENAGYSGEI